jgi:mono/diheme cytochrome c family protein
VPVRFILRCKRSVPGEELKHSLPGRKQQSLEVGGCMYRALFALPLVVVFALLAQDQPTLTNPVTPTAESQTHAKARYTADCSMCHADNGNGKGGDAVDMGLALKDFNDPATLQGMSDGQIFTLIKKGRKSMPAEGDKATDEEIWNLVIYVRSFAKK